MFRIRKFLWISGSALALLGCWDEAKAPKPIVHAKVDNVEIRVAAAKTNSNGNPNGNEASSLGFKDSASAGIRRVTLSAEASKRLGIQFADVTASATSTATSNGTAVATAGTLANTAAGDQLAELPYNALLYDASGGEWVFVSPAPNVYMRTDVKVERIDGDRVTVSKGPAPGSKVVTMGAAELYGIEFGVGK